jgi:hypothetical protein
MQQQLMERRARRCLRRREAIHPAILFVAQNEALVAIEHAQTLRHVLT